jgi:hypothetical protein
MKVFAVTFIVSLLALMKPSVGTSESEGEDYSPYLRRTRKLADQQIIYPIKRYGSDWSKLDPVIKDHAIDAFYSQRFWDHNEILGLEHHSYETVMKILPYYMHKDIDFLVPNAASWDCWINHYKGYTWQQIEAMPDVLNAFEVLGWTMKMWVQGSSPPSEFKDYAALTQEEKQAAKVLCYDEYLWDRKCQRFIK